MQRYATSRSTERSLKIAHVIAALRQITLKERVLASHTAKSDNAFYHDDLQSIATKRGSPKGLSLKPRARELSIRRHANQKAFLGV